MSEPRVPDFGMSSEQLSHFTTEFALRCGHRIIALGKPQYDLGDHQAFEDRTLDEMIEGTLEELEDAMNHAIMSWVLLRRQQIRWKANGVEL